MAEILSVLGQKAPLAGVLMDVFTVPDGKQVVVSTFTVCNQSTQRTTFRLSIAVDGAADEEKQYVYYDCPVDPKRTFAATIGATLAAGDVVRFHSGNGALSLNIFGSKGDA